MSLFSGFLVAVFAKLFDLFGAYIGKKVAIGGAVIATSLALLTAFWFALKVLVAGLMQQVTDKYVLMSFYVIWPANAEFCIAAYWSAQLAAFAYREHRENLRALTYIT